MARGLPPPPLLLLLLALSPGGAPSPTLALDCPADIVLKEGDTRVINSTDRASGGTYSQRVYVRPEVGFKGIRLLVDGTDDCQHVVWFPAEPKCFPTDGKWYDVGLWAKIDSDNTLIFGFHIGTCRRECEKNNPPQSLQRFSVVGHGSSKWILKKPGTSCDFTSRTQSSSPSTLPTCEKPPRPVTPPQGSDGNTPHQTDTSTICKTLTTDATFSASKTSSSHRASPNNIIIIAAPAAGGLVVLVVVVAVVCRKRKAATNDTTTLAQATETCENAIENDLYEPFDKYGDVSTSPGHEEAPYTIENDLYEPFDEYCDDSTSPGHEEAPYAIENDLYEPFSGDGHGHNQ